MSHWFESAIARVDISENWQAPARRESLELLKTSSWPTRKTEAWKYTPLRVVEQAIDYSQSTTMNVSATSIIEGLNSVDLPFVNGRLQLDLAALTLPVGLRIVALKDVSAADQAWATELFSSIKPKRHIFGLLNDVLAADGLLIDVAEGTTIEQPLRIIHEVTANTDSHLRILVRVGEGASVSVIEQHEGSEPSLNTCFAEYDVAEKASLEHYRFALQTAAALSAGGSHFQLHDNSRLNSTIVGFGSDLARVDVDVIHAGEHAFAKLNAIYLLDGKELFDLHSTIEHAKPNGTTEENVRGIVADRSRAVFNGRIHIHRDAQKTLAELNNRNLLMSNKAEINTKPELEIYADDVRCAHGATVAEIDKKALYYMQSRGLSRAQAQLMLNFGFINELVDQMPSQVLAEWLRPLLRARFAVMDVQ